MTKTISLTNFKGGTAKSASAQNIAAGLALRGKKVLLVDLDPQHNLTSNCGITQFQTGIYDNLIHDEDLMPLPVKKNLDIIPSSIELVSAELQMAGMLVNREIKLLTKLAKVKDLYNYIIIDCPPSLGLLTINGIFASDIIFVPVETEQNSYDGLRQLIDSLDKIDFEIDRVFLTKYQEKLLLHQSVKTAIETKYRDKLFKTPIRKNVKIAEAATERTDIFDYNRNCTGAWDYKRLVEEILNLK